MRTPYDTRTGLAAVDKVQDVDPMPAASEGEEWQVGNIKKWHHTLRTLAQLWLAGFKDAICLHRCIVLFVHDKEIRVKTGRCFALNGLIFLGSILLWEYFLSPGIRQLLLVSLAAQTSERYVNAVHSLLCAIFGIIWLVPVYMVSFPLSCFCQERGAEVLLPRQMWPLLGSPWEQAIPFARYQEIAELALHASRQRAAQQAGEKPARRQGPIQQDATVQLAQELYRSVLFAVFFLQTYAIGLIPYVGAPANFVLLSWLNALYSFDYKWSLTNRSLQERMHFFEHHWAFFAGFGSVCTLVTLRCPFFSGAAILAIIYPLCILIACESDPLQHYKKAAERERAAGREMQRLRLPIFLMATRVTGWIISHSTELLQAPQLLWRCRWYLTACVVAAACCIVAASFSS